MIRSPSEATMWLAGWAVRVVLLITAPVFYLCRAVARINVQPGRLVVARHPRGGAEEKPPAVGNRPEAAATERQEDLALGRPHHQGRAHPQHHAHDGAGGRPKERTGSQKETTITAAPASSRISARVSRGTLRRSQPHQAKKWKLQPWQR